MDSKRIETYLAPLSRESYRSWTECKLQFPKGRKDICVVLCSKSGGIQSTQDGILGTWAYLVWEQDGQLHHRFLGGAEGYKIILSKDCVKKFNGQDLELYFSILNFIGSSGGARFIFKLGKPGAADPVQKTLNKSA